MVSNSKVIGKIDDPKSFISPKRFLASLIWFSEGQIEYIIPNVFQNMKKAKMLEISFEISSEFPISNNNWPSDITFWINNKEVGTWTVPGDFSDVRGKLTPQWWNSNYSQYGLLKHLRIQKDNTGLDAEKLSDVSIYDLNLSNNEIIKFRIGVKAQAKNLGGLTLFGKHFGNYPQDINVRFYYTD